MTTEPELTPGDPAPEPKPERLPDDHPAAVALRNANEEAKALRLKLQEIEDKDKSELQKLQDAVQERDQRLADLPGKARSEAIRFASKASQKGFLDPEDALMFIDVDLGDDAAVTAALDELAERKPHLVRSDAKKLPSRPKPPKGDHVENGDEPKGKERAAAALRQFRNT